MSVLESNAFCRLLGASAAADVLQITNSLSTAASHGTQLHFFADDIPFSTQPADDDGIVSDAAFQVGAKYTLGIKKNLKRKEMNLKACH